LIGRSYLLDKQKDGQTLRAFILKLVEDHLFELNDKKTRMKFLLRINDNKGEEIITYNQLLEHMSKDQENDIGKKFQRITSHQGPLTGGYPDY
jgi:hypothetical protein